MVSAPLTSQIQDCMKLPIFVINRACDDQRLNFIRQSLDGRGLSFERIDAVDGFAVPSRLRPQFFASDGSLLSNLLPGEVGCYASHLLAAEQIAERKLGFALILEDDAELAADFSAIISAAVDALPEGWDIVRLSSDTQHATLSMSELGFGRHLVRYSRIPKKSGAYLLSNSGARKLLLKRARVRPVDADLRYAWTIGLDTYGVHPPPASQDTFASTIRIEGMRRTDQRGGRWQRPGLISRIHGFVYGLRTLGFSGWLNCLGRNAKSGRPETIRGA